MKIEFLDNVLCSNVIKHGNVIIYSRWNSDIRRFHVKLEAGVI